MRPIDRVSWATVLALLAVGQAACGRQTAREPMEQPRTVGQVALPDLVPKELVVALLAPRLGPDATGPELLIGRDLSGWLT
jgi:hypothetical protein